MSTASTPAIPAGSVVKVVKAGDSLLGKIFTVIKEDAEHVVASIKTEVGMIEAYFEKKHVNVVAGAGTTTVEKTSVMASEAAKPTDATTSPSTLENAPSGTPEPETPAPAEQPSP